MVLKCHHNNSFQDILAQDKLLLSASALSDKVQNKLSKSQSLKDALSQLREVGVHLEECTYAQLLKWCGKTQALSDGRAVHEHIVGNGLARNRFLCNHLFQMYSNCGELDLAFKIYNAMRYKDVFTWSFIIKACVQHGQDMLAFQLFENMQREAVLPDNILLVNLLPACFCPRESDKLHARLVGCGNGDDLSVGTTLIKLYGKCDQIDSARKVFESMAERDTVAWTSIIAVYAQHKLSVEALQLFGQMVQSGIEPDNVTFLSILSACASYTSLVDGMSVHYYISHNGLESNKALENASMHFYSKCGALDDLQHMFDHIDEHDVVLWTAIIVAYAQNGLSMHSAQAFEQMYQEGVIANRVAYMSIICACDGGVLFKYCTCLHARLLYLEFGYEITLSNAIINVYGKFGSIGNVLSMFDDMLEKDVISWNVVILSCAKHGEDDTAVQLFKQMHAEGTLQDEVTFLNTLEAITRNKLLHEGKQIHARAFAAGFESNLILATALMNMYGNSGSLEYARVLFNEMPEQDIVAWNAIIEVHSLDRNAKVALQMYEQMHQQVQLPEMITYVGVLSVCADHGLLLECKLIHTRLIIIQMILDLVLGNSLINTYAKCGSLDNAWTTFQELPTRDIVTWNTIIGAYAQNGIGKNALQLFQDMQKEGVSPNGITFLNILTACSHSGLVDETEQYLISMREDHDIEPDVEHYNCIVDVFGRAGHLDKAEKWVQQMPVEPTSATWLIFLNACRQYVDVKRGEQAAERVFQKDPKDVSPYILLSNIYVSAGRQSDAIAILNRMLERGLKVEQDHPLFKTENAVKDLLGFQNDSLQINICG